jgi:hypothetical protein
MLPVLGQWAVTCLPSDNTTSARNRLYRLMIRPSVSGGNCIVFLHESKERLTIISIEKEKNDRESVEELS